MKFTSKVELIVKNLNAEERKIRSSLSSLHRSFNRPMLAVVEIYRHADKIRKLNI